MKIMSLGPITLFDKSFLQSLSIDESVWFDNFFYTNICPIFYLETLGDLNKVVRTGRTPEDEVRIIADKTPEMQSGLNAFHRDICVANLMGEKIKMVGSIMVASGRPVKTADQCGILYEPSPESEAFYRWQRGEFLELERQFARKWRQNLGAFNLEGAVQFFNKLGINAKNCKTIGEAKSIADAIANADEYSFERLKFILSYLNIPEHLFYDIYMRWGYNGCPSLKSFAPYAAHVFTVELFFYIAAASQLISQKKVSDKLDLAYLFYLPFCMIFVSSDRIHKRCTPLFLRDDQRFVWGEDLKSDLQRVDRYFDQLPEHEKEKGLHRIASQPPPAIDLLVCDLWDQYLPKWRDTKDTLPSKNSSDHLVKNMHDLADAKIGIDEVDFDMGNPDAIIIKRKVRRKKGKWWQIGTDIPDEVD